MSAPVVDLNIRSLDRGGAPILRDVALTLHRGETLALAGPSGVGKTSLLHAIAGLDVSYDGHRAVNGTAAMVFQEPTLLPWRSVAQNITLTTPATDARPALAAVGLADRADMFPNQLSLGQQRRLSLARAFATQPDLLLLDEPFVSLDAELVSEMMDLFARLRDAHDVATILVTHVEAEARSLCTRMITLGGQPATITGDETL
ncbi:ABC transporter ATP-binding protein [Tateyamaria sp. SN6-1]|uniref:ABC transporter ATP-binding protein n=1 Tax=Tateyamaria sp. SN6-1 TaxID=3092148 RepID=UPI0039F541F8